MPPTFFIALPALQQTCRGYFNSCAEVIIGFDGMETHNSAMMNPLMIGLFTIGTLLMCYFPYFQAKAFIARLFNSFFGSADAAAQSKYVFFGGWSGSSPIPKPEFTPNVEPPKCVEIP